MTTFLRFAVVHRETREPIEGCVYSDYFKAKKRLRGLAAAADFEVARVVVSVDCARPAPENSDTSV